MTASHALPRPTFHPFEWEGEENATRTRLPILDGLIAAVPLRLVARNSGRDTPGTFGHLPLCVFHNHRGYLANFLHVSVSFVAAIHVPKHGAEGGQACSQILTMSCPK